MMSKEHEAAIRTNLPELVAKLSIDAHFISFFQQEMTLTDEMCDNVLETPTRRERARELLKYLPTRGEEAFRYFMIALVETNQLHLAKLVDPTNTIIPDLKLEEVDLNLKSLDSTNVDYIVSQINDYYKTGKSVNVMSASTNEELRKRIASCRYKITEKKPRGRAIIVSFSDGPLDAGLREDISLLTTLFKGLHLNVVQFSLSSSSENSITYEKLTDARKSSLIEETDETFILFMLRCPPRLQKNEVEKIFNGDNCPFLKQKPVVFFLQRCDRAESSVNVTAQSTGEISNVPASNNKDGASNNQSDNASAASNNPTGMCDRLTVTLRDVKTSAKASEIVVCLTFIFAELAAHASLKELLDVLKWVVNRREKIQNAEGKYSIDIDSCMYPSQFYFLYSKPKPKKEIPANKNS